MNAIIRNIPNYITISNLCCGLLSIIFTLNNQLDLGALFIFLGVFLDFFDGFFARVLKVENDFGIQLDSMADLITSGYIAQLDKICDLAEKYDALVIVDDCHSTGFVGKTGRGTHEHCDVIGRVDIITGTLGKALGGAMGGFTSGRKEIIEMLRQKSRPYLFSNSLAPSIVGSGIKVLEILEKSTSLRDQLEENTKYFRKSMSAVGFDIKDGVHPIVPVMLYDAKLAGEMADKLLDEGIYVIGFSFPVVPKDEARIRVQISAAHSMQDLDKAINAFVKVGKELKVL